MATVYKHKNKLYAITNKVEGRFYITKASQLPDGKQLIEEIRSIEAKNITEVKRLIKTDKYDTFEKL